MGEQCVGARGLRCAAPPLQVKAEPLSHWDRPQRVTNLAWGLKVLQHRPSLPFKIALAKHLTVNWPAYKQESAVSLVHSLSSERMCLPRGVVHALQRRANEAALKLDRKSTLTMDSAFKSMLEHAVPDLPAEQHGPAGAEPKRPERAAAAE